MNKRITVWMMISLLIPLCAFGQDPGATIHTAVLRGDNDAIRQFVEAGADLNQKDAYGSTPLTIAITFGKSEVAETLIGAGADLEITNNEGSTSLLLAALFGRTEIVKSLLDNGADRFARNNDGSTAYDIVSAPFEEDRWLYDNIARGLAPLGLKLDYDRIKESRPVIARLLRPGPAELETVDYAPAARADWSVSTPSAQGLNPNLVAELYLDAAHLETIYSLLVIRNGRLVAEKYFNEGAVNRKYLLQSVTKSFTSALVGIALEQGCLENVDRKMMAFFPELAGQISDPRKNQITVRHLLQMRAGYPWEESTDELFELLYSGFRPSTLVDVPLVRDPGTGFAYSNLSSHLLSIIVSRACDTDLKSFAEEYLFGPLGVEAGFWQQDWEGYYNGHGDLHLTARDVARFGLMYLDDGVFEGERIEPAAWVDASLQSYSRDVNTAGMVDGSVGRYLRHVGYGYQWWSAEVDGHPFNLAWGHGGQFIFLLDAFDTVVVVTSNPFHGQHDDEEWKYERTNLNLVGKFIRLLYGEG
jgi:CubicO group peptidase (beta-lactamase class C family)